MPRWPGETRALCPPLGSLFRPRGPTQNSEEPFVCCLTFELSGRQRQDARPGLAKMYSVPPDRAWRPAVGAPLERGVRRHCGLPAVVSWQPTGHFML